ncbi:MAG TPA: signal peptidase I [Gemmatimonadaceae bacterium]|nr:signal peptidase I [Gemmatimonadaceae bacterium]
MAKKSQSSEKPASTAVADARGTPRKGGRAWENIKSIAITVAVFLFLRAFFIEAYRIPSGSMVPTLLIGDWLFVNKLRYGPHVPFTKWNLPGYAEPKRGDVAVFVSPFQTDMPPGDDPTPTLVKRVQGIPGDTLHMRDGMLYLNGEPRPLPHKIDTLGDPHQRNPLFAWQKEHALKQSRFGAAPDDPDLDNWGPIVVPPGHYFMMGDARYDSKDSRYWGLVPRANFRGRTLFVYYSFKSGDASDRTDRPLPAITAIRWGRIGDIVR